MKTKRDFPKLYILLILGLYLFLIPTISLGATFCVDSATGLQTALTTATSNGEDDTIKIVQGTYSGNFVYASTEAYGVTIEGGYTPGCASRVVDPDNTVLDGNATGNVLVLSCPDHPVEFQVEGVTLFNGKASDGGSALYALTMDPLTIENGAITLLNNTIIENSVGSEGTSVVYAQACNVTLVNNTITRNSGGGVKANACSSGSPVNFSGNMISKNSDGYAVSVFGVATFTSNTISENSSIHSGGGVWLNGDATFKNNIITGNSANGVGGGLAIFPVYPNEISIIFIGNTISGNSATSSGGGVYLRGCATFANNLVAGNSSGYNGGGLVFSNASIITLTNNTISNNSSGNGGGVHVSLYEDSDIAKIYNNIIYNNSAETEGDDLYIDNDGDGDFIPSTVNLYNNDLDHSESGSYFRRPFTIDPSNLDNANPLFVDVPNNNYHLTASSPCINVGNNSAPDLPTTDRDANPRISDGIVDMGAYEFTVFNVETSGSCGGKTPCYRTIQEAINVVNVRAAIRISQGTYSETPTLSNDKTLILQGGWDTHFENQTGTTILQKAPKAEQGSLTLQNLNIKP